MSVNVLLRVAAVPAAIQGIVHGIEMPPLPRLER